ncbi:hypothetical protein IGJ02_000269 [Enterococcus sp. DIV0724b]|uniref:winged helix-turn-helix transcriptional regulator n=1 Tax=Enterococcus sp. DIV0724b TaxID=2774694 RepID=UPI003D2FD002
MYKIGYVALTTTTEKDYMNTLKVTYENVHSIEHEQVMLKKSNELDVIIIQDDDNQYVGNICEMIIHLRKNSDTLVWIISEHLTKANRSVYPRLGADGIAGNECEPDELVQLITNALNRYRSRLNFSKQNGKLVSRRNQLNTVVGLELVPSNFSVMIDDNEIDLTKLEYLALEYLHQNVGRAVSYDEIYQNVWKDDVADRKYRVSNLIFHLRKKIEKNEKAPMYIKTVRSKGYMLVI